MEREQVTKLLLTGKTDLLTKFISKKGRPFSAYLAADDGGKTRFEFEEKRAKVGSKVKTVKPRIKAPAVKKTAVKKTATKKTATKKTATKN
jgi:DNA topoisomerase-3